MRNVIHSNGVAGLYKGFTITLIRDVPSWGSYFYSYDLLKKYLANDNNHTAIYNKFLAGGSAGAISWLCSYPIDVVKTII